MRKQYLSGFLFLVLTLGIFSSVSAQDGSVGSPTDSRVTSESRMLEFKAQQEKRRLELETQRATKQSMIEAQREKMRAEVEARKAAATAQGDEMQVKREAVRAGLEAKRAEMDAKREVMRVEAEAKRAEMKAKRIEFQQEIAKRKVAHTAKVILVTVERLENIVVRVESRIAKVKARGGDTSESEKFVAMARVNLADARVSVSAFANIDLSSEKAQENFERIRAEAAIAREHTRAAHQNLMLANRSLGRVEENRGTATSTATSTSN